MRERRKGNRSRSILLALCTLAILGYFTRGQWLGAMGRALVSSEEPAAADAVVVLAGDMRGDRVLKGVEVARQGFAPKVYISGPEQIFGHQAAEMAVRFAKEKGYQDLELIPFDSTATSTREEVVALRERLLRDGVKKVLVVTSTYHTARTRRVFQQYAPELEVRMVAAPSRDFDAGSWWQSRSGQETFFFESIKTVAYLVGI